MSLSASSRILGFVLALGLAGAAGATPTNGLEARLRLLQPPPTGAKSLSLELGLENVGDHPISLRGGFEQGLRVELQPPREQLGCLLPPLRKRPSLRVAPGKVLRWRGRCRVVASPGRIPTRLSEGGHSIRAVFDLFPEARPGRARAQGWTGEASSGPIAFEVPARPGEEEPPLERIPPRFTLSGCEVSAEVHRFFRYFVPPRQSCGRMEPPREPLRPGEKPAILDVLRLGLRIENRGARSCRILFWRIVSHGPRGERTELRSPHLPDPREWSVEVAPSARVEREVAISLGVTPLTPNQRYVLAFSLEDEAGTRAWLQLPPVRFSPPEENPVPQEPSHCDPRIP
jgi:hypothetical protein